MKDRFFMNGSYFRNVIVVLTFLMVMVYGDTVCGQGHHVYEYREPVATEDTIEIRRLYALFDSARATDMDKAEKYLLQMFEKSKIVKYHRGIYLGGANLGAMAQHKGKHDKALEYFLEAAPYANQPGMKYPNILYNNIGVSYSSLGKYKEALKYYNKTLEILKDVKEKVMVTDSVGVYNNIAILWARLDETDFALENFELARKIAEHNKDTAQLPMTYNNIAEIYFRKNMLSESESYFRKSLVIAEATDNREYIITAYSSLSEIAYKRGNIQEAVSLMHRASTTVDTTKLFAYDAINFYAKLATLYLNLKDYAKAKFVLEDAIRKAYEMHHIELQEILEPKVAEMYAGIGAYKDAYTHLQRYANIKDSLVKREKAWTLDMLLNARMADKNKEVLAQQLEIAQQQNQLQHKNILIGGTILGALLLLAISAALMLSYRHKQAIHQSVIYQLQQKQEINQLKAQVRGEEQERQRIARELHDSIASQLWAIKLNVESMQQQEQDDKQGIKLEHIYKQVTDATQDVRKTAHNLMPDLLLEEGLGTALASTCDKIAKSTGLEVDFQEYGDVPRFDPEIELSIYRMVQELTQNVLKHAKDATQLLVQVSCVGTLLNITVEDNGIVLTERSYPDGMGLREIKKRTTALKGHFDLQAIPGKGTTAYFEFDLQHLL